MRKITVTNEQLSTLTVNELLGRGEYIEVIWSNSESYGLEPGVIVMTLGGNAYFLTNNPRLNGSRYDKRGEFGYSYSWALGLGMTLPDYIRGYHIEAAEETKKLRRRAKKSMQFEHIHNAYRQDTIYTGIHGYHSGRCYNEEVVPTATDSYRIGVELEVECNTQRIKEEIDDKFKSNWLLMERDGSLSDRGIEFITIPMLPKYIKSTNTWADFIEFMSSRAKSWNTTTCGLHVHIGREILGKTAEEQSETIGKLLYLYHHYLKEHATNVKIYGRTTAYSDHDGKVAEGSAVKTLGSDVLKLKSVKENLKSKLTSRSQTTRYFDINLTNSSTIEFRKGKGSLNSDRICMVIEYSELLCLYARKAKWEKISADDFFEFAKDKVKRTSPLARFIHNEEPDC